ncbi:LOW QUALITY PROTEIN: hypothetical protein M514_12831 [Trichuris suis]|uniref:Uncharacterized protein n=1 Tax=Trichuris suis TaxID=68888 RepID=A0A085MYA9_9BILA|nr:LOW QUALITY PROTEIN: hypothetical protein M514_12831 [Trichuris suis]
MEAVASRNAEPLVNVHANLSWVQHFKFSHTSNGYNYYTDVTGRYYAHDEAGKWYIQDAKGRFVLWTSEEETTNNTVATKDEEASTEPTAIQADWQIVRYAEAEGNEAVKTVAEEPMANQCVEMDICDDDAEAEGNGPTNLEKANDAKDHATTRAPVEAANASVAGSSGLMADQSSNLNTMDHVTKRCAISGWEDYSKQYYQQYGYMPTYEATADGTMGGGPPFSNAGWIVTGGRRTKVRPEDIDLPPGPPPSCTSSNHYAYGLQHYMGYAAQAIEDQRGKTASASIVRQLKQFASLKNKKEDGAVGDSLGGSNEVRSPGASSFERKAQDEKGAVMATKQEGTVCTGVVIIIIRCFLQNANGTVSVQSMEENESKLSATKDDNVPAFDRASLERSSVSSGSTDKSKRSRRKRSHSSSSSSSSLQSRSSASGGKHVKNGSSSTSSRKSKTSDKVKASVPKKRAPSPHFPKLTEESVEVYQPVFVLTTETELPWPSSRVKKTKCSPSITYSYTLRGAFKHLLATHRKVREENYARRRFEIEEHLRRMSSLESSSFSETSDSDLSEKRKARRHSSSSSRRRSSRSSSAASSSTSRRSNSSSSSSSSGSTTSSGGNSNSSSGKSKSRSVRNSSSSSSSSGGGSRSRRHTRSRSTSSYGSVASPVSSASSRASKKREQSVSERSYDGRGRSEKSYSSSLAASSTE